MTMTPSEARRAVGALDLTSLNDDDDDDAIERLCARAVTPVGPVAAVCVQPRFVPLARRLLSASGVRVATVINFPHGEDAPADVAAALKAAAAAGADEIDVVVPWRRFLAGDHACAAETVKACVQARPPGVPLKVIVESGAFADLGALRELCDQVLEAGADFLKTSTGKFSVGATPEAAGVFYDAILAHGRGGVKISGGVRTCAQAKIHIDRFRERMGEDRMGPERFRIGASALLDALLAAADGKE